MARQSVPVYSGVEADIMFDHSSFDVNSGYFFNMDALLPSPDPVHKSTRLPFVLSKEERDE